MRRMVVIPEELYLSLISSKTNADEKLQMEQQKLSSLLQQHYPQTDDQHLYADQKLKQIQAMRNADNPIKPVSLNEIVPQVLTELQKLMNVPTASVKAETSLAEQFTPPSERAAPSSEPSAASNEPPATPATKRTPPTPRRPKRKRRGVAGDASPQEIERIATALMNHRDLLPLDETGRVLKSDQTPYYRSSIQSVVRHLLNPGMGYAPKGFKDVEARLQVHPHLRSLVFPNAQNGGGCVFRFTPLLWKKF